MTNIQKIIETILRKPILLLTGCKSRTLPELRFHNFEKEVDEIYLRIILVLKFVFPLIILSK
jgi:hypothetical protein